MKNILLVLISFTLTLSFSSVYAEATLEDVENSFYPYKSWTPEVTGVKPGLVISQSNVEQYKEALDEGMYQHVKDGWVEITVGETTSFDLHQNYVEATRKHLNQTTLGDQPGIINNFVAGRPFPEEPDLNDPRAGDKLAWNFQYGYNWGDNALIEPFYWRFKNMKNGKLERTIKLKMHFLNWKHRVNHEPIPEMLDNPSGIFRSIYFNVQEPFDVKNTQALIHRYENDLKRDDSWLYLGFQRRVRRLSTGQVTDSLLGTDISVEDIEGYNGRISDMTWTYKGTKNILVPFYYHNDQELATELATNDGYQYVDFHGKGKCFPKVTWQLRKVYILESVPTDPNHPISKRVHYVDAQTYTLPRTTIYDRKGDLWKSWMIGQAHSDHHLPINKGAGVSIDDNFAIMDLQSQHCTTGHFKGIIDPEKSPAKLFSVQNMRVQGR